MGLLLSESGAPDSEAAKDLFQSIAKYWHSDLADAWGFDVHFGSKSIDRICYLAAEHLFRGQAFPESPGPFKRAAAIAILSRLYVDFEFRPRLGSSRLSMEDAEHWKARLSFLTIPVFLKGACLDNNGNPKSLRKLWQPASLHIQAEIINWLRWLERPQRVIDATTPEPSARFAIDLARLCRSIMVFAMVIEQSYYIRNNNLKCDVFGDDSCVQEILKDPLAGVDIWFNLQSRVPNISAGIGDVA